MRQKKSGDLPTVSIGDRFGLWTVTRPGETLSEWWCRCDCGRQGILTSRGLLWGRSRSCGHHAQADLGLGSHITEAPSKSKSITYRTWSSMLWRCQSEKANNPKYASYRSYAGKGIKVCERWQTYEHFLVDVGERPSRYHSIDRIDNARGYEPGNVRWATQKQQMRNTDANHRVTSRGLTLPIAEWCERNKVSSNTVYHRLNAGAPEEVSVLRGHLRRHKRRLDYWDRAEFGGRDRPPLVANGQWLLRPPAKRRRPPVP
jgi:hypothetical protein